MCVMHVWYLLRVRVMHVCHRDCLPDTNTSLRTLDTLTFTSPLVIPLA